MSGYYNYRGRCIGRVIHFLYHYCGSNVATQAIIGQDYIEYCGKKIATYTWMDSFGEADVPKFEFIPPNSYNVDEYDMRSYRYYTTAQLEKKDEAIEDALILYINEDSYYKGFKNVDEDVVRILKRGAFTRGRLWAGIASKRYSFFLAEESLFLKIENDYVYKWDDACNNWLKWEKLK